MTNLPTALPDECDSFSQIETVWPRTLEEYENVSACFVFCWRRAWALILSRDPQGQVYEADYATVRFLYQPDTATNAGRADTIFTLRLKASALFERASRLGSRYCMCFNIMRRKSGTHASFLLQQRQ